MILKSERYSRTEELHVIIATTIFRLCLSTSPQKYILNIGQTAVKASWICIWSRQWITRMR